MVDGRYGEGVPTPGRPSLTFGAARPRGPTDVSRWVGPLRYGPRSLPDPSQPQMRAAVASWSATGVFLAHPAKDLCARRGFASVELRLSSPHVPAKCLKARGEFRIALLEQPEACPYHFARRSIRAALHLVVHEDLKLRGQRHVHVDAPLGDGYSLLLITTNSNSGYHSIRNPSRPSPRSRHSLP